MSPVFSWMTARMKYLLPVLAFLGIAVPAAAQGPGVRGGVSIDPDQVYFGGHYETDALVDRLHFKPNLEVGIGDDVVATTINMEFVYKFPSRSRWLLYAGGGPAINFYSYDDDGGDGDTNTEGGLNLLFGVENRGGLFFEVKVGVGFTFR